MDAASSVMMESGTDTISNAFMNANELIEGVKVITRVLDATLTENSFIESPPFGLKLLRSW